MSMKRRCVRAIIPVLPGTLLTLQDWRGQGQVAFPISSRIASASPPHSISYSLMPKPSSSYVDRTGTNFEFTIARKLVTGLLELFASVIRNDHRVKGNTFIIFHLKHFILDYLQGH